MRKVIIVSIAALSLFSCGKESTDTVPVVPVAPAPTAATLSLPADKELCLGANKLNETYSEVSFEWQAGKNVTGYDITITNLNTNVSQTKYTTQNKIDVVLEAGLPYSWYVTSKSNSSSEKVNSSTWKFYLSGNGKSNLAPYPADGLVPKSGASVGLIDGKANLSWVAQDPDSNGSSLTFEVFIDTDPSNVLKQSVPSIKTNTPSTTVNLKSGQVYYWMVKISDGDLASYTQIFSFRTI